MELSKAPRPWATKDTQTHSFKMLYMVPWQRFVCTVRPSHDEYNRSFLDRKVACFSPVLFQDGNLKSCALKHSMGTPLLCPKGVSTGQNVDSDFRMLVIHSC